MEAMWSRWNWVIAALVLVAASVQAGEKEEEKERDKPKADALVFRGEGRARNRDEEVALEEAIVAAKEDALEEAAERLTRDIKKEAMRSVVKRYIAENLTPDKCIEKFEITSKERKGSSTRVKGKATFNDTLPQAIKTLRERMEPLGYPRLMVVLNEEYIQPQNVPPIPPGGMMAQMAVEQVLIKNEFRIVDKATVSDNARKKAQNAIIKNDNATLARLAGEHGADVFIGGQPARAEFVGNVDLGFGRPYPRYVSTIDIRAIDCHTARLMVAQSCQGGLTGQTHMIAVRNAFKDAGAKMAKMVVKDILYFWLVTERTKTIDVVLKGVKHADAVEIAEALVEEEDWAKRHGTVGMKEGVCRFPLTIEGTTTTGVVADTIKMIDKKLKVVEVADRRVVLQKPEE